MDPPGAGDDESDEEFPRDSLDGTGDRSDTADRAGSVDHGAGGCARSGNGRAPDASGESPKAAPTDSPDDGTAGSVSEDSEEPTGATPTRRESGDDESSDGDGERASEWETFARDVGTSALAVLLVGGFVFAVSGVWPPMVAVESPSMTPNMQTGDLVFVMDEHRFPGEGAQGGTGVVTARTGRTTDVDYPKFGREGDVIVYTPDGSTEETPIIHRAMFWVEEDENWYGKADRQSVGGYSECGDNESEALPNCPAPHAGFITKGDANGAYDQAQELSSPVKPSWVVATAEVRVPKLGCIRLRTRGCATLVTAPGLVGAQQAGDGDRCWCPESESAT